MFWRARRRQSFFFEGPPHACMQLCRQVHAALACSSCRVQQPSHATALPPAALSLSPPAPHHHLHLTPSRSAQLCRLLAHRLLAHRLLAHRLLLAHDQPSCPVHDQVGQCRTMSRDHSLRCSCSPCWHLGTSRHLARRSRSTGLGCKRSINSCCPPATLRSAMIAALWRQAGAVWRRD